MIDTNRQALRYLLAKMPVDQWRKGTGWVDQTTVDEAIREGLAEPKGEGDDRVVRLTLYGILERAIMGPDGTIGRNE